MPARTVTHGRTVKPARRVTPTRAAVLEAPMGVRMNRAPGRAPRCPVHRGCRGRPCGRTSRTRPRTTTSSCRRLGSSRRGTPDRGRCPTRPPSPVRTIRRTTRRVPIARRPRPPRTARCRPLRTARRPLRAARRPLPTARRHPARTVHPRSPRRCPLSRRHPTRRARRPPPSRTRPAHPTAPDRRTSSSHPTPARLVGGRRVRCRLVGGRQVTFRLVGGRRVTFRLVGGSPARFPPMVGSPVRSRPVTGRRIPARRDRATCPVRAGNRPRTVGSRRTRRSRTAPRPVHRTRRTPPAGGTHRIPGCRRARDRTVRRPAPPPAPAPPPRAANGRTGGRRTAPAAGRTVRRRPHRSRTRATPRRRRR